MNPPPPIGFTIFEVDPDLPLPPELPPWASRISLEGEPSYPEAWQPWMAGTGAVVAVACAVLLLATGSPWLVPVLLAALGALYAGLRGPQRRSSLTESPRGRFVLVDAAPPPPSADSDELERALRRIRWRSHRAAWIAYFVGITGLIGYFMLSGGWLQVAGPLVVLAVSWAAPRLLFSPSLDELTHSREVPVPEAGAASMAVLHPNPAEVLRGVGRQWTFEEFQEARHLVEQGMTEDEACRSVRADLLAPGSRAAAFPTRGRGDRLMRRLSELARSEPWEKGETAVSRRGRELMAPQVSLPVRMLSGLLAVFLGWGASLGVGEPGNLLFVLGFVALAVVFASIAIFGVRSPVIDPPASRRFLDLADPARALPPSTDPDVPSRGP